MGKDLGTYHVKVELKNKRGFYQKWKTGYRYAKGTEDLSPLDAYLIAPKFANEQDLIKAIIYMYTEGNYSCDCNLVSFIAEAYQEWKPKDAPCGDTIKLERLTLIRPDASSLVIYEVEKS